MDNFYYLLGLVGIVSLLFFRMVRKGAMVYAEAWRNLFSLLIGICAIFLFFRDLNYIPGGIYSYLFTGGQIALLVPSCYLILKFIFAPLYFSASSRSIEEKLDKIYVGAGKIERFVLRFVGILSLMLSVLILIELFDNFELRLFLVSVILLLAGLVLFVIRNTLYAEILTNVAITHLSRGNLEKCNDLLQESLRYKRDLPKTWAMLTEVHRKMGDWDAAKRYLVFLKRIRPSSELTGIMETKLEYSMERYAKCVKTARRELNKHPGLPELLVMGGKASVALDEYARSLEFFEPYFNGGGVDLEARGKMVKAYFKTKQYENAIKAFNTLKSTKNVNSVPELLNETKRYYEKSIRLLKIERGRKVD